MLQNYKVCKVEDDDAFVVSNQTISEYNMDVYYIFGKNEGGLFKVAYILSDESLSKEAKTECRRILSEDIRERFGDPDTDTKAVTTWNLNEMKIEIGTGRFKKYKGTDTFSVGVFFTHSRQTKKPSLDATNLFHQCEKGDTGKSVKNIQYRLIELGYLSDQADGIYGNNTKEALEKFQSNNGLTPDGIASPAVQVALFAKGALSSEGVPWTPFNPVAYESTPKPTKTPKPKSTPKPTKKAEVTTGRYVGNAKSGKFHKASCGSVKKMNDSNKVYFSSREEAVARGYVPCKICHP